MDKTRMPARGRKMESRHRNQARGALRNEQIQPVSTEELSQSEILEKIQGTFQEHDGNKKGVLTQADMQKLEGIVPWSKEELELVFDGLDTDSRGYVVIEEFTEGLRSVLNSGRATREHRKRKGASARTFSNLALKEANTEEQKCFEAFINQSGADKIFEERVADHNQEVQQLCEEMEQQIENEKQRMQYESRTRSQLRNMDIKKALDAREREIQHFLTVQKELETQFVNLKENQKMADTQPEGLKQVNRALEKQLQETLHQLQRIQSYLDIMQDRVSQMFKEDRASGDTMSVTEASSLSRTRVISIEEDPVVDTVGEEQYRPQEPSGQSSLFKEMNEAIATMSRISESHNQPTGDFDFQGQELMRKTRQAENYQQSTIQQNISQDGNFSKKGVREKRISETLTSQAEFQRKVLLKEAPTFVQDIALKMKKSHVFEPRVEVKSPESMGTDRLPPRIQHPLYSSLTAEVHDWKEGQIQRNFLALQPPIQYDSHKQALKSSDIIQTQELSTDTKQGAKRQSPAGKTLAKRKAPHTPLKKIASINSSPRTTQLKLHVSLAQNGQLKSVPELEVQSDATELLEVPSLEKRREGGIDASEYKKNQEVKAEMDERTRLALERRDCQATKETSQNTTRALIPHPDHLYNVLFVGDTNVGKTSFLRKFQEDSFGTNVAATVGIDYRIKNLFVDDKWFILQLWDTAGQERYHSLTKQFFRKADGVVLMYDITSEHSFTDVKYWLNCIKEGAEHGVVVHLLGNKTDCTAERRISRDDGEFLAKEYGLSFCECSAASGHNVAESMVKLARLLKIYEDQLKQEVLQLSVPTKEKRGCCS